jgi:ferric-dicitrate binding protein FerR (iron transport regulator)
MDPVRRTHILGQRYFDGLASAAELAELEALLRTNPQAADAFAHLGRLEADLSAQFSEEPSRLREAAVLQTIERSQRRRRWWGHGIRVAIAASFLLLFSGSLLWWLGQPAPVAPQSTGHVVLEGEVLVDGQEVEHLDDGAALMVAGPAPALLRLSDGSRARLEPASEAVLHGASEGVARRFELIEGEGRFIVRKAAEPFLVDTPAGSVRTQESEFSVRLTKPEPEDPQTRTRQSLLAVRVVTGRAQVETDNTYSLSAGEKWAFAIQRNPADARTVWYVVDFARDSGIFAPQRPGNRASSGPIFGIVSDIKDSKLTISFGRRSDPTRESFQVGESVKIAVDGKPGKLTDLMKGTLVRIERNDMGELLTVTTEGPTVSGMVKAVDDGKITLDGRGRPFIVEQDTDYAVPADAKITIDRRPAKLADLKPGHRVLLKLSINRKSALVITSMGPRQERPPAAIGQIKTIDTKAGTIIVSDIRGNQERTLNLVKNVTVVIDGQPAKLDDLKAGKNVVLRLDREGKTVQMINIMGIRRPLIGFFQGVVAEVKDGKLTVSFDRRNPKMEKTFDVSESVRIVVDGKPVKLANLTKGMTVQLGQDDKGALVVVRAEGPTVGGKVKDITVEKITLQGRREDADYVLSPSTMAIIDRKPARPADVKVGMDVSLKLSVDGKTVLVIRTDASRQGWVPFVNGRIKAIDTKARTITLAIASARAGVRVSQERTFSLGKDVKVIIEGRPAGVADLKVGTEVTLTVDREGKTVYRIAVQAGVPADRRREKNNRRD